jgi:elongation factor G
MLEALADFDDTLLEQLLEDSIPPKEEIYSHLQSDIGQDLVVPVMIGAGEKDHGVRRLMKALRHDTPGVGLAADRRGLDPAGGAAVQLFKTLYAGHAGKLSLGRVMTGEVKEGDKLGGEKLGTLLSLLGSATAKRSPANAGHLIAIGRVENLSAGELLSAGPTAMAEDWPTPPPATYGVALHAENRQDEVKLSGALHKLREEDSSYQVEQDPELNQLTLSGHRSRPVEESLRRPCDDRPDRHALPRNHTGPHEPAFPLQTPIGRARAVRRCADFGPAGGPRGGRAVCRQGRCWSGAPSIYSGS